MNNIDVNIGRVVLDDGFNPTRQVLIKLSPEFFIRHPETDKPEAFVRDELAMLIGRQVLATIDRWVESKSKNHADILR